MFFTCYYYLNNMKISPIQYNVYQQNNYKKNGVYAPHSRECKNLELDNRFYYPTNISFKAHNAEPLRKLCMYGLPCMRVSAD